MGRGVAVRPGVLAQVQDEMQFWLVVVGQMNVVPMRIITCRLQAGEDNEENVDGADECK